jgi:hypothetical protein
MTVKKAVKKAVKKVVKKTKKLNRKGILELADMLVVNKKFYDQDRFGKVEACGTFCCQAGFCYLSQVGKKNFNKEVKAAFVEASNPNFRSFVEHCINAGITKLGLALPAYEYFDEDTPQIFSDVEFSWPEDLVEEYQSNGPTWRVIAALRALSRLKVDGTIDENPKAVHTRIPQLKALLDAEKAKKKAGKSV